MSERCVDCSGSGEGYAGEPSIACQKCNGSGEVVTHKSEDIDRVIEEMAEALHFMPDYSEDHADFILTREKPLHAENASLVKENESLCKRLNDLGGPTDAIGSEVVRLRVENERMRVVSEEAKKVVDYFCGECCADGEESLVRKTTACAGCIHFALIKAMEALSGGK